MTDPAIETARTLEEAQAYQAISCQSFNVAPQGIVPMVERIGLENIWVVHHHNRVAGGLGLYRMGQWFGGQVVPMAGVGAVAIAPQLRGIGLAKALLQRVLRQLHQEGVAISALHAATQVLYRRVGYEQAGTYCRFSVPVASLQPGDHQLPMQPIDPENWSRLRSLYQQQAGLHNGHLERHPSLWEKLVHSQQSALYAYLLGTESDPQGYVIFTQSNGGHDLLVRDQVCLSPTAGQRLLTFWADHRSLADQVYWYGSTSDPFLRLFPEQTFEVRSLNRWFLRIVDVVQALSLRGYPAGLRAELHLEITDELLSGNQGRFVLTVADGQGQVVRGGTGALQLEIQDLAPLYSGFWTAHQLQAIGKLSGTPEALAIATLIFSGPEPWLADLF